MTVISLSFSETAAKALGSNTRLRVKTMIRGGIEYVALRPSYRVSGKNAQIRTTKNEADGSVTAELTDEIVSTLNLPELKDGAYLFEEVSNKYGWYRLKPTEGDIKESASLITIRHNAKATAEKTETPAASAE